MIRPYAPADLDALLAVWDAASAQAHPFLSAEFQATERDHIATRYLDVAETWVYEDEVEGGRRAIVGFMSLIGAREIGALFVDPDHQHAGVGTALVAHAQRLRGDLDVEVFAKNPGGRAFYAARGFREVGRKQHELAGHELIRLRLARGA